MTKRRIGIHQTDSDKAIGDMTDEELDAFVDRLVDGGAFDGMPTTDPKDDEDQIGLRAMRLTPSVSPRPTRTQP